MNASPPDDEPLIAFLRDRDVPCPRCGYNLRNLTMAKCPECEHPLALTLVGHKVRIGMLVLAVIPSFLMFIIGAVGVVAALVNFFAPALVLFVALAAIEGMLTVFLLKGGHLFTPLPAAQQAGTVFGLWVLQAIILFVFVAIMSSF